MSRSPSRSHFVLVPVGSGGDVFPFVGIGAALLRRGHEVTVLTGEPFRDVIEGAGLRFRVTATSSEYRSVIDDPDLWHPTRSIDVALGAAVRGTRVAFAALGELWESGRTVLVGSTLAFAMRAFEERHDAVAATIHLSPNVFRSDFAQPIVRPGLDLTRAPRWVKRALWRWVDRVVDARVGRALNRWRSEVGLGPVQRVFRDWIHSPRRVIALFPDWYGPPQPDWPAQLRFAGFSRFDDAEREHAADRALETFLGAGEPPIVLTPGTAQRFATKFFEAGLDAATRLGRRALLLTRHPEQLPSPLPDRALHVAFAPLSRILPRCAAVVHHGGVGTCAQGLAAGIPQLVMPMAFDQPDNAARLERLGVGAWITPRRFAEPRVAATLDRLLRSADTASACRRWRDATAGGSDGADRACDLLEELILGDGYQTPVSGTPTESRVG